MLGGFLVLGADVAMVSFLAVAFYTGEVSTKMGHYTRKSEPIGYWFSMTTLSLFIGTMIFQLKGEVVALITGHV